MAKDSIVNVDNFAALAPPTEGFSIKEVIKSNFGIKGITAKNLQRVSVPAGGAISWQLDTMEGPASRAAITGIIVAVREPQVLYLTEYDGSNTPPDCYSPDGIVGVGNPGGRCDTCEHNEWGTGKGGRGKRCQERRMILVLEPDTILPMIISAPPTSLGNFGDYMGRLTAQALPKYSVVTEFTLERDKNPDGAPFSKIKPKFIRKLRGEEIAALQDYIKEVIPAFEAVSEAEIGRDELDPAAVDDHEFAQEDDQ